MYLDLYFFVFVNKNSFKNINLCINNLKFKEKGCEFLIVN